jgi:hypothetical protein
MGMQLSRTVMSLGATLTTAALPRHTDARGEVTTRLSYKLTLWYIFPCSFHYPVGGGGEVRERSKRVVSG